MQRITIKEIARRAGTSIGTVDRVLHNRGEVAESTRELVLKVAREGNYQANIYARNLKLNRNFRVAILLPEDNEYWTEHNRGLADAVLQFQPLGLQLEKFTFDRHNVNSFHEKSELMLESKPSAVVMAPLIEEEVIKLSQRLDASSIPYVFVDSNLDHANPLTFIGQDSRKAGYLSAKLLNFGFSEGHSACILRYHDFDSLNKTIEERIQGFRQFYADHNFDTSLVKELDFEGLSDEIEKNRNGGWLHIFVPNSRVFEIEPLLENKTFSTRIVGFDLIQGNAESLKKGLVDFIIHQNPYNQGEQAIRTLHSKLILGKEVHSKVQIPLEIITKENLPEQINPDRTS